jgi:hypothetical protein
MSTEMQTKVQANPAQSFTPAQTGLLQRKSALCNTPGLVEDSGRDKEKLTLQRSSVDQARTTMVPPIVHEVLRSTGQPLDASTRAFMEPRFGYDFRRVQIHDAEAFAGGQEGVRKTISLERDPLLKKEIARRKGPGQPLESPTQKLMGSLIGYNFRDVRIHTDSFAAASAKDLNAEAFTVGKDIFFGTGRHDTKSPEGRSLIAHELTHVVQQSQAVPDSLFAEREAERNATSANASLSKKRDFESSLGSSLKYSIQLLRVPVPSNPFGVTHVDIELPRLRDLEPCLPAGQQVYRMNVVGRRVGPLTTGRGKIIFNLHIGLYRHTDGRICAIIHDSKGIIPGAWCLNLCDVWDEILRRIREILMDVLKVLGIIAFVIVAAIMAIITMGGSIIIPQPQPVTPGVVPIIPGGALGESESQFA